MEVVYLSCLRSQHERPHGDGDANADGTTHYIQDTVERILAVVLSASHQLSAAPDWMSWRSARRQRHQNQASRLLWRTRPCQLYREAPLFQIEMSIALWRSWA
eukprot:5792512-Amphidinium_carterae.2